MDPVTLFWTGLIVYSIQCGIGCGVIADSKNRDLMAWFICGLLFGLIGVLMAIGVTARPLGAGTKAALESRPPEKTEVRAQLERARRIGHPRPGTA